MQRDPRTWLWDAREASAAIGEFVAGLDVASYSASELVRSAVERKFEIIGEALNQLSKAAPVLADRIPDLRRIVGFRNVLIHGYALVDHRTVWEVVSTSLPELRRSLDDLLDELGPPGP
jgi:uncharacterized protein with HEPN domain